MKKLVIGMCVFLSLLFVSSSFGHDGSWTTDVDDWASILLGHTDDSPWKGVATVTVTNTMTESWGDFHFEIYEFLTTNVIFTESTSIVMKDSLGNVYSGYSYVIEAGEKKLDFYFYGNPVNPGETVTFQVYTDNTASTLAWFGLVIYPTPVPEPATLGILSLGALLLRKKK